jgi:hypothetical protein
VEDVEVTESQWLSYLLWRQRVLPERRFPSIHQGLKEFGGFRSDEAAALRCDRTVPLKKLHRLDIVEYGQVIPKLMTYVTHDEVALHKAALNVHPDEQMSLVMSLLAQEGHMKGSRMARLSPLGYASTLEVRQRLTAGLLVLRDADNRYYLTRDTGLEPAEARKEVIRRMFRQFGTFSAEMLGFHTKGEYRMFELRSILRELEREGLIAKAYLLRDPEGERWYSDSLHWVLREDLERIRGEPAKFDTVLTARDNLAFYLTPMVATKFGMGSAWLAISDGTIIGAATVQLKKRENIAVRFEGSQKAWDMLAAHSLSLGKRMVRAGDRKPAEPEAESYDDVTDWYEKFVRPGG